MSGFPPLLQVIAELDAAEAANKPVNDYAMAKQLMQYPLDDILALVEQRARDHKRTQSATQHLNQ